MNYEDTIKQHLLSWYDQHQRKLPWRESRDPYKIWVSEIMLQQTRVDQVRPYFDRFIEKFPDVHSLAAADRQEVMQVWEGLGYYSRARNLHDAAKKVVEEYNGRMPDTWKGITDLKGIGPYTAAAILSIAFDQNYAVMDGNVKRVITRLFGIEEDIRKGVTEKEIQQQANELLDEKRPGDFNQALMELGATICTPKNPNCNACPVNDTCVAYRTAKTETIPYKSPAKKKPHHQIGVGIVVDEKDQVLIALRPEDAMLGGLWEFPGGKQKESETMPETIRRELAEEMDIEVEVQQPFMKLNHAYSHFKITMHAYLCRLVSGTPKPKDSQEIRWVPRTQLDRYPFPKANRKLTEALMEKNQLGLGF